GIRPDLRLPGRRVGPRARAPLRPRALRRPGRARGGAPEPRAHRRGPRAARLAHGARAPLLARLGRGRGAPGLRALAGEPARPLAPRPRLLQRQRLHRADRPRLRRRRPLAVTSCARVGAVVGRGGPSETRSFWGPTRPARDGSHRRGGELAWSTRARPVPRRPRRRT